MPLDWSAYDDFAWADSSQRPLDASARRAIEAVAADILALSPARQTTWGAASPPGRYAATVIRLASDLDHAFRGRAAHLPHLALKLFKTTPDARREAERLIPFHRAELSRLPGLPHPRVQRSLTAGVHQPSGRAWIVLEWIEGQTLDVLHRAGATGPRTRSLLAQLLGEIIIPLWNAGTVWWDVRDANWCVTADDRLMMIDVDSLAACAEEILHRPGQWAERDKARQVALPRLRQTAFRLLLARGLRPAARVERVARSAWEEELLPALQTLGRPGAASGAAQAVERYLDRLAEAGFFQTG